MMTVNSVYQNSTQAITDRGTLNTERPCVVICPGVHGHAVARSLGRLGVSVYGVHADRKSPSVSSRYWRKNFFWDLSKYSDQESLEWFKALSSRVGPGSILIPTDDHSCLFIENNAEVLQALFEFPKQPKGLANNLINKKELYSLCKQKSILTPMTIFPQSRRDVLSFTKEATFPVMLKGIDTVALQKRTGVRMEIVHDAETLLKRYSELESHDEPSLMIQEFIEGGAENVWMFDGYFDKNSDCLFGITGRKLRQFPAYTGMTSLGVCENNLEVADQIKDFMKSINYRGILDIGYKYDSQRRKYFLLDPNPRLGVTFRLFVDSFGNDVIRILYRDLTGQQVVAGNLVQGRRWISEPFDLVSSFRYWKDRNLTVTNWLRSFKKVEEAQWFAWDDIWPFLKVIWYSVYKAVQRNSGRRR